MGLLTLQTSTFSVHGGIPTFNRLVCRTLNGLGFYKNCKVLVATDNCEDVVRKKSSFPNLELEAFYGNRTRFVQRILHHVMKQRIDLLLAGHVNYAPLGYLLRLVQPELRYGVFVHGVDVWSKLAPLRRQGLQQADFIISVSEYSKRQISELNGPVNGRFYLLPNALQWDEGYDTGMLALPTSPIGTRLLTVCRLDGAERYKGVDMVIEALPSVAAEVPAVKYVIVGSGSDTARLKELARRVGVAERVDFLGSVNDSELRLQYQACDVFVMPSAGEGFGIVFLEAMQYSKPIVAANSGGSPEVVQNEGTGLLVRYGDILQLKQTLVRLCLNPELRSRLGQAGRQRLQERFTFPHFKKTLTNILFQELPASSVYKARLTELVGNQ